MRWEKSGGSDTFGLSFLELCHVVDGVDLLLSVAALPGGGHVPGEAAKAGLGGVEAGGALVGV